MWGSGEEEEVFCGFGEFAAKLEAFGVVGFVAEDLGGEFVSFIDDYEIPRFCGGGISEGIAAC